jgi:hypothetical protein
MYMADLAGDTRLRLKKLIARGLMLSLLLLYRYRKALKEMSNVGYMLPICSLSKCSA